MSKIKSKTRAATRTKALDKEARLARLTEVARLGRIMLDGELIGQLLSDHGRLWKSPDDIDYNYEPFIAMKKTVLRLEQTPADGLPVFVNIWRQRPDQPDKGEPLLAGMKLSLYGRGVVPLPRALRTALLNERTAADNHPNGAVSVFAPLYDSLHHVAGAVEVFDDPQQLNVTP